MRIIGIAVLSITMTVALNLAESAEAQANCSSYRVGNNVRFGHAGRYKGAGRIVNKRGAQVQVRWHQYPSRGSAGWRNTWVFCKRQPYGQYVLGFSAGTRTRYTSRCRAGRTLYKAKSGKGYCCPVGTKGYYKGYNSITCRRSSSATRTRTRYTSRCSAGQTLYKAKSGKGYCCPSGTKGYYKGYNSITCRRYATGSTRNTRVSRNCSAYSVGRTVRFGHAGRYKGSGRIMRKAGAQVQVRWHQYPNRGSAGWRNTWVFCQRQPYGQYLL